MPEIRIDSLDGSSFDAYLAAPSGENGPGLIVIHEIFGLNDSIKSVCDSFAAQGFFAVCPNLFWRQTPAGDGATFNEETWDQATKLYKNFDIEAGVRDLLATLAFSRRLGGCAGKVGTVGYCLGGRLAYLLAARSDIDCAVSYYGVGIDSLLDEIYDIRVPFLLHLAEQDKLLPLPSQKRIAQALARNEAARVFSYAHADHGFARRDGTKFNPEAASLAEERTLSLLKDTLFGKK